VCPSGCVCDQPPNWKTEELTLNCLKAVELSNLGGTDHEAALVKRLFGWATVLKTMTVTFDRSVTGSKAKEFCQMLQSISRPEICLQGPHFAWSSYVGTLSATCSRTFSMSWKLVIYAVGRSVVLVSPHYQMQCYGHQNLVYPSEMLEAVSVALLPLSYICCWMYWTVEKHTSWFITVHSTEV
jgi:hypothetical protein